jgi:hypothetical protein
MSAPLPPANAKRAAQVVCAHLALVYLVDVEALFSTTRDEGRIALVRRIAWYVLTQSLAFPQGEVAAVFGRVPNTVRAGLCEIDKLRDDGEFAAIVDWHMETCQKLWPFHAAYRAAIDLSQPAPKRGTKSRTGAKDR